jgi:3-hydroxyacyl-CoA dehydrogenase
VTAVVILCAGRTFFAGADITEFGKPFAAPGLHDMFDRFDGASKPIVAAIHGTALGGGLELALACHYRVAVPSAKLGLPEVALGLLPGAGGTQRAPRLIGVAHALDLIVGGKPVSAAQALRIGLIDRVADGQDLRAQAVAYARELVASGARCAARATCRPTSARRKPPPASPTIAPAMPRASSASRRRATSCARSRRPPIGRSRPG